MGNLINFPKKNKRGFDTCYYCGISLIDQNIDHGGFVAIYKLPDQNYRAVFVCGYCHKKIQQEKLKKISNI